MLNRRFLVAAAVAVVFAGGAQAAVQFGYCPFDLVGGSNGHCSSPAGEPITLTVPLDAPARWMILSMHQHDPDQKGSIYVDGNATTGTYRGTFQACAADKTATQLVDLGQYTSTVTFAEVVNISEGRARDPYARVGHSEFLAANPGINLAAGATTAGVVNAIGVTATAFGTGANPQGLFDSLDYADNGCPIWRADSNLDTNYVGVTFDALVDVDALRISVTEGLDVYRWLDFDVQVQRTVGGAWETIGRANEALTAGKLLWTDVNGVDTRYLWIDLGGMEIAGVQLFGSDAKGNNARGELGGAMQGWFLAELQVWSGVPVPEPATMTLLVLGGLAMLRRRK